MDTTNKIPSDWWCAQVLSLGDIRERSRIVLPLMKSVSPRYARVAQDGGLNLAHSPTRAWIKPVVATGIMVPVRPHNLRIVTSFARHRALAGRTDVPLQQPFSQRR